MKSDNQISFLNARMFLDRVKVCIGILSILLSQLVYGQQTEYSDKTDSGLFRASVVVVDITPEDSQYLLGYNERKSVGVDNHIYHRIVALDDGKTQFFLISTEVCLVSPMEYDRVAAKISDQLGIDPINFWWTVTHTHSAPELGPTGIDEMFLKDRYQHNRDTNYTLFVENMLIKGIKEAKEKLAPARLGAGWGYSQANINRRAKDINGLVTLGMNPDGAVDRRIGLLRIDSKEGSPLACIANYPIHGTVLGSSNVKINGDVPGTTSKYFEDKTGVPLLFINGAAGNLAPIYSTTSNPSFLKQFPLLLGNKIIEAYERISSTTESIIISAGHTLVETPLRPGLEWPEDLSNYIRKTKAGNELVKLPIRFLKINEDIAIWSSPLELFCEISNGIRDNSPFHYTFYFGYTNGWLGYLLTADEYALGGYELKVSPFTSKAEIDLTEAVNTYLHGEMKSLK